jgi:hypothetical protein
MQMRRGTGPSHRDGIEHERRPSTRLHGPSSASVSSHSCGLLKLNADPKYGAVRIWRGALESVVDANSNKPVGPEGMNSTEKGGVRMGRSTPLYA